MSTSVRYVVRGARGRVRQNFNLPGIIRSGQAVVHVTAGEIRPGPTSMMIGPHGGATTQEFMYNLGDADVWVSNVSPHFNQHFEGEPGGVEYILHVNWDHPLDIGVTITVEDHTPVEVQN